MKQNIQIRIINFKIFIISTLLLIPLLLLIIYISNKLSYNPIYFIIISLVVIVGSMIRLEQKSTKYVILNFKDNELLIEGKQNESLLYSKILNFNLYSLFPKKKLGYIFRIQQEKGNFYFWITTKNKNMKWGKNDYQNILILNNSLEQKVQKKQLFIDYIIFGIALIPTIIISFVFLFVFVVLFSLFTGNIEWFQYL